MTQQQVKDALGPDFTETLHTTGPRYPGEAYASGMQKNAIQEANAAANQEAYTLEYVADRVVFIHHDVTWKHEQPNTSDTLQAIVASMAQRPCPDLTPVPGVFSSGSGMLMDTRSRTVAGAAST